MAGDEEYGLALGDLRAALARFKQGQKDYDQIAARRERVLETYGPIFSAEHIPSLAKDEFVPFLYIENNGHWSGLHRQLRVADNMERLRQALAVLLDEARPMRERFPQALGMVPGLGRAIATGILTVAYPDLYGV